MSKAMSAIEWLRKESTSVNTFISLKDMEDYAAYVLSISAENQEQWHKGRPDKEGHYYVWGPTAGMWELYWESGSAISKDYTHYRVKHFMAPPARE